MNRSSGTSTWSALVRRRYGDVMWDGVVRGTGALALLALVGVVWLPAAFGQLVAFVVITIWVNGPAAVVLPATYEPILMLFGRIYPPVLIATLGIAGTLYVEFLNYHLYRTVMHAAAARGLRESALVQWTVRRFRRAPFFTVWLCSWSPLPYWAVRIVGPMAEYPVRRYLLATLLGRFPRLWFFAALGIYWHVSTHVLIVITAASIAMAIAVLTAKRGAFSERVAPHGRNSISPGSPAPTNARPT